MNDIDRDGYFLERSAQPIIWLSFGLAFVTVAGVVLGIVQASIPWWGAVVAGLAVLGFVASGVYAVRAYRAGDQRQIGFAWAATLVIAGLGFLATRLAS